MATDDSPATGESGGWVAATEALERIFEPYLAQEHDHSGLLRSAVIDQLIARRAFTQRFAADEFITECVDTGILYTTFDNEHIMWIEP